MKSDLLNPRYDFNTKALFLRGLARTYRKSIIVTLVLVLHLFGLWSLSYFIEPYTLANSPKVNALKVHFVSLSTSQNPSPQTIAPAGVAQVKKITVLEKPTMSSAANRNTETTAQKAISSQLATQEVQKSQPDPKVGAESAKPSYQQNFVTQAAENKVKYDVQAQQSSQILTDKFLNLEEPTEHAQSRSGGVKTAATQQELTRAPENQVERSEPVQVSSVDVLSFGKFAYDDRELKQQNRIVELRLRINESGKPTEIELKQSSGIASLDERVLQAARQSKFKPYKINGHAVAVVVDFPVQLKLSRSR